MLHNVFIASIILSDHKSIILKRVIWENYLKMKMPPFWRDIFNLLRDISSLVILVDSFDDRILGTLERDLSNLTGHPLVPNVTQSLFNAWVPHILRVSPKIFFLQKGRRVWDTCILIWSTTLKQVNANEETKNYIQLTIYFIVRANWNRKVTKRE